jgi:chromosome partitioning protein
MQTIAFISQKGGSGKTTTASALAVAALQRGLAVAVFDTDPQASILRWSERRNDTSGKFVCRGVLEGVLEANVQAAERGGFDLAIIDTAGNANSAAVQAAKLADVVLVPCEAQTFSVETLGTSKGMIGLANDPTAYVLLTKVHHAQKDPVSPVEPIAGKKFGLEVAPVWICDRGVYKVAPATGQGPQEIERDGKATAEINALLDFVAPQTIKQSKKKRA